MLPVPATGLPREASTCGDALFTRRRRGFAGRTLHDDRGRAAMTMIANVGLRRRDGGNCDQGGGGETGRDKPAIEL
jgi:hypothetical protein